MDVVLKGMTMRDSYNNNAGKVASGGFVDPCQMRNSGDPVHYHFDESTPSSYVKSWRLFATPSSATLMQLVVLGFLGEIRVFDKSTCT